MEDAFQISKKTSKKRNDTSVQGTNDSSILSKVSTCQSGYFEDEFLKNFVSKIVKRSSLVNRGYYIRAKLIDFMLKGFLEKVNSKILKNQIINLGAGFDATFFRLKDKNLLSNTLFIEIDFPDVINRKVNLIKSNQSLTNMCPDLVKTQQVNENIVYRSFISKYVLIGIDMRNTRLLETLLKSVDDYSDLDMTFLLSEVVLTYMAVNSCNGVLKWISETFQNSILTVYEQINPYDAFGQVMCSHFKKLGSPLKCIFKYPTINDQINRYKQEGFSECLALKANDFYCNKISRAEKLRIEKLELFDEYEQWHLKCSHYILLSASKGELCTQLVTDFYKSIEIPNIENLYIKLSEKNLVKLKPFDLKFGIRFGHSVCSIGSKLFVSGGFGELANDSLNKHMRHTAIEIVDLKTMNLLILDQIENLSNDRIYHTSEILPPSESNSQNENISLLIIYGRSNPSKLFNTILKINVTSAVNNNKVESNKDLFEYKIPTLDSNTTNLARFRHASCFTNDSNLFIYGGKVYDENLGINIIVNDAYLIDNQFNATKVNIDETICQPRRSHSLCTWNNYIIISGGLDINENPLNDIILIDCKSFEIKKLVPSNGFIIPRYSHTSHVIDNTLILVGGVNYMDISPGVCFLDLNNLTAYEFSTPCQTPDLNPFMLVNHQTHLIDKNNILVIGGGGICFTFGTHLNKQPMILDLTECWSHIV